MDPQTTETSLRIVQCWKALIVPAEKAPFKLVSDFAVPTPEAHQVLVKIVAAGICPADARIQAFGAPFIQNYPFLGGFDVAGVVEEVGADVTSVKKGDRILCPGEFAPLDAGHKEYSAMHGDNVAKIPDSMSFEDAATVPLGFATAVTGMWAPEGPTSIGLPAPWEEGGTTKYAGKPAVIVGGSSSVGQFAIQAARMNGFSPVVTTAAPKHAAFLRSLGATHVVDRALPTPELLAAVSTAASDAPVAFAYDAIGEVDTQRLAYAALGDHGGFVSVMPRAGPEVLAPVQSEGDGKRVARLFASFQVSPNQALGVEVYKRLTGWLADGTVKPNRVEVIPGGLSGIPEGAKRVMEGR
ncbi:GroES-like protein [Epithele typhae]|uniref:GroES-like protein n=1 Tax=Epithele typhae TaxID=378194 RepID=UPI002008BED2|nr:GroES-like protein [Epithele typhae]KAH9906118.1 GroES-like protein [Epithele typhae]